MPPTRLPGDDRALVALRRRVLDAPAEDAAAILAVGVARMTGAGAAQVRLCDRALEMLHVVGSTGDGTCSAHDAQAWPLRDPVTGDVTAVGDVVLSRTVRCEHVDGAERVHVPLAVRGDVSGVLTLEGPDPGASDADLAGVGEFAALLVAEAGAVTDHFEVHRRSWSFSVSAELQWQILPAMSVADDRVELHALVEPAPRVTSDLFDWSLDRGRVSLVVLDAEGRSLSAALPATVAVAALRHARRTRLELADQAALTDQAIYDHFRGCVAVRALVLEVDLDAGTVRGIRTGEPGVAPRAFRRRGGRVEELVLSEQEALGRFERSRFAAEPVDLRPGDDLLVVSDGGPEARDLAGAVFGSRRVAEHFTDAAGEPLGGIPRRLLDRLRTHSGGELDQDATVLVLGWRPRA